MAKQTLGKGLKALIGSPADMSGALAPAQPAAITTEPLKPGEAVRRVAMDMVVPSPLQPRKEFAEEHLAELVESIREHGVIQPLIVRRVNGKLELIAGERRYRASSLLGLREVPVIEREASDQEVLEMALIENLQREDLNPIEEARAYERLSRDFGLRQEDIARKVGRKRATIANAMRLLDLTEAVQDLVKDGRLTAGHAKALLSLKSDEEQARLAREVQQKGLSVRATEKLVERLLRPPPPPPQPGDPGVLQAISALEQRLLSHLKTNVSIRHQDKRGRIEIDYYGVEQLNGLMTLMGLEEEEGV